MESGITCSPLIIENKQEKQMIKHIPLLVLLLPCLATAEEDIKSSEWKGEGELGFTSTSGNTNSDNLNAKLGIQKSRNKWTHKARLEILKASTEGVDSSDRKVLTARSEYKFAVKTYAFGALRHEDDKFSGFDYQSSISVGLGQQLIKNESHELDASAGIGYRKKKVTATGITTSEGIVIGNLDYLFNVSKHAIFKEKILVESGSSNTYTESETSLKMKINGNLASKITYTIKNNSTVPAGTKNTDKITSITLVYSF